MLDKIKNLGQVFTGEQIVDTMMSIIKNQGSVLEPSCGTGNFSKKIKNCVSIEFDKEICPSYAINIDFFDYPVYKNCFDTIIGNPPYVGFKSIIKTTKSKIDLKTYDNRTNLHIFFIDKCLYHLNSGGEIIFITPREFIKQTSAIPLINKMHKMGTFTHFYDYGDEVLFKGFSPNCAIWRFEKDNFSHETELLNGTIVKQQNISGQMVFSNTLYDYNLSDLFDVKVGGVSGLDSVFVNPNGNEDFVYSKTNVTGKARKMYYNDKSPYIKSHESILRKRKIKTFDDSNWWQWGRDFHKSDEKRIYVNCKTRNENPFFKNDCNNYDGSILALFLKDKNIDIDLCIEELNKLNWKDLGFKVGGRYCFSQRALQNIKLPTSVVSKFIN
jgi:adenine-specific DNA-methyltransferase